MLVFLKGLFLVLHFSVFFTKLLTSDILFSTAVNAVLVAKPLIIGTVFNLSASILSTSVFKLARFYFDAKLLTSTYVTFFKSVFVGYLKGINFRGFCGFWPFPRK